MRKGHPFPRQGTPADPPDPLGFPAKRVRAPRDPGRGRLREPVTLAFRLRLVLQHVSSPDGDPFSAAEVARATGLSASYLTMLRAGRRRNPTTATVRRLAAFFDVPLAYFYEDLPLATLMGLLRIKGRPLAPFLPPTLPPPATAGLAHLYIGLTLLAHHE